MKIIYVPIYATAVLVAIRVTVPALPWYVPLVPLCLYPLYVAGVVTIMIRMRRRALRGGRL